MNLLLACEESTSTADSIGLTIVGVAFFGFWAFVAWVTSR